MSKRNTNFFGGLVAFLLAGMNASSGFAQAPVSVNQAIGGRTLGLESICGECKWRNILSARRDWKALHSTNKEIFG